MQQCTITTSLLGILDLFIREDAGISLTAGHPTVNCMSGPSLSGPKVTAKPLIAKAIEEIKVKLEPADIAVMSPSKI